MRRFYSIYILVAGILWAMLGVFVKMLNKMGFDSTEISSFRWIFAAIIVCIIFLFCDKRIFRIKLKDVWMFALLGIVGLFATSNLYFLSMTMTSIAVADVLMYSSPVWVMVFSIFVLNEKMSLKKVLCAAFTVVGCMFVCGLFKSGENVFNMKGMFFGILSGITYGCYSIIGKLVLKKYSQMTQLVYSFIFAAVCSLISIDVGSAVTKVLQNTNSIKFILCVSVICTAIPFGLYTLGLRKIDASKAAVISCVEPATATLISMLFMHETADLLQIIGIIIIITAILLSHIRLTDRNMR